RAGISSEVQSRISLTLMRATLAPSPRSSAATLLRSALIRRLGCVWLPRQYRHDVTSASQYRVCGHRWEKGKAASRYRLRSDRRRPRRHTCLYERTLLTFALWLYPLHEVGRPTLGGRSTGGYQHWRSINLWNDPHHMDGRPLRSRCKTNTDGS